MNVGYLVTEYTKKPTELPHLEAFKMSLEKKLPMIDLFHKLFSNYTAGIQFVRTSL